MTVVVEDHVVGAAGFLPMTIDVISDQAELPSSFTERTRKKYS